MNKLRVILTLVVLSLSCTSLVDAQAKHLWVSGVGGDANPCSRTAPCKTFVGVISKTAADGEIDCIDPVGFGTITRTKPFRMWVSGVGGDANPRSGTVSSKTWAIATARTADKDELERFDTGGFHTMTINNMTLAGGGTFASILASDINGVNVNDTTYVGGSNTQRGPTAALSGHVKAFSSRRVETPTSNPSFRGGGIPVLISD